MANMDRLPEGWYSVDLLVDAWVREDAIVKEQEIPNICPKTSTIRCGMREH